MDLACLIRLCRSVMQIKTENQKHHKAQNVVLTCSLFSRGWEPPLQFSQSKWNSGLLYVMRSPNMVASTTWNLTQMFYLHQLWDLHSWGSLQLAFGSRHPWLKETVGNAAKWLWPDFLNALAQTCQPGIQKSALAPPDIINNIQKENNTFKEGARWGLKAKLSNVVPETLKHSIIFHFNFHLLIHCVAAHLQNQWSAEGSKCHTSAHMTRKIKNIFSKGIFYCHVWLPEGIQFRIPFLGVQ